ncbi:hypothetical protein [Stenotrophomonas sp. TWI809]|uniref:hypothetical protein n=1 Tax=Stenotrophomonas sp. TWI809 TaxID=3136796 RepID=UPI0032092D7D
MVVQMILVAFAALAFPVGLLCWIGVSNINERKRASRISCNNSSTLDGPADAGTDVLEPEVRRWMLSQAGPHVWAAAFVNSLDDAGPELAMRKADSAAAALERIQNTPLRSFESVAAKSGLLLDEHDFKAWYRVCDLLRSGKSIGYVAPADQHIQDAYDSYVRSLGDFN